MENNPYIEEAVNWLLKKASMRDFHEIARDAGIAPQTLKYQALQIIAGKTRGKRGRPRKDK